MSDNSSSINSNSTATLVPDPASAGAARLPVIQRTNESEPHTEASNAVIENIENVVPTNRPVINEHNAFRLIAGPGRQCFTIDVTDLRRESALFRQCTIITSIELRHEDPQAVQLIENWFSGNVGMPPLSNAERNIFRNAARIARNLQILELESQLLVIVDRIEKSYADLLWTQRNSNRRIDNATMIEYVLLEAEPFMVRSPNTGGVANEDHDDYDPAIHGLM